MEVYRNQEREEDSEREVDSCSKEILREKVSSRIHEKVSAKLGQIPSSLVDDELYDFHYPPTEEQQNRAKELFHMPADEVSDIVSTHLLRKELQQQDMPDNSIDASVSCNGRLYDKPKSGYYTPEDIKRMRDFFASDREKAQEEDNVGVDNSEETERIKREERIERFRQLVLLTLKGRKKLDVLTEYFTKSPDFIRKVPTS